MKRRLLLILIACFVGLSGNSPAKSDRVLAAHENERAVVEFKDQVKLLGVFLKGEYLIIHDHEKMARGEDCTYIYRLKDGKQGELVVSFHCTPQPRPLAESFRLKTSRRFTQGIIPEVTEIQFGGSREAHLVPSS
ncbi:MAG: hypothetical protein M3362_28395 [Acidobacteriota bacterium]|nr:hypothetical protein [Acidobacteriota bacterium]